MQLTHTVQITNNESKFSENLQKRSLYAIDLALKNTSKLQFKVNKLLKVLY